MCTVDMYQRNSNALNKNWPCTLGLRTNINVSPVRCLDDLRLTGCKQFSEDPLYHYGVIMRQGIQCAATDVHLKVVLNIRLPVA